MAKKVVVRIAKANNNALIATGNSLAFSSEFDSMKIKEVINISHNVPENTVLASEGSEVLTYTTAHNLGYIPFFTPEARNILVTSDPFNINDNLSRIPVDTPNEPTAFEEYVSIYITETNIVTEITQIGDVIFETDDITFPAHTIEGSFVLYYNRIDETVDYT